MVTPPPVQALPQTQPIPPAPQPQQQSYQHSEPYRGNIEYGGILQRFLALLVDGIIVGISFSIISGIFSFIFFRILPVGLASWLSILINLVLFVGVFAYYAIGYGKYGTTIGKKLFKLYIVDQKKLTTPTMSQGIIRALVQFFLSGIFFIGYIMAFFNPEHKTLHDMLAKTYVIRK
nr:RDD family protein [Thermotomaculum hydrothermale]